MARLVGSLGAFWEGGSHKLADLGIEYGVFSEEDGLGESADGLPELFAEGHGASGAGFGCGVGV